MKRTILIMQVLVLAAFYFFFKEGEKAMEAYREIYVFIGIPLYKKLFGSIFSYLIVWFLVNLFKKSFGVNFLKWYAIFNLLPALLCIIYFSFFLLEIHQKLDKNTIIKKGQQTTILQYKDNSKTTLQKEIHRKALEGTIRQVSYYENGKKEYVFNKNDFDTLWYASGQIQLVMKIDKSYNIELLLNRIFSLNHNGVQFIAHWDEKGEQLLKNGFGKVLFYYPKGELRYEEYFENYMTTKVTTFYQNGQTHTKIEYLTPDLSDFACSASELEKLYAYQKKCGVIQKEFSKDGTLIVDEYAPTDIITFPLNGTGTIRFKYQHGELEREIIMKEGKIKKAIIYYFYKKIKTEIEFGVVNEFKNQAVINGFQDLSIDLIDALNTIEKWKNVQKNYNLQGQLTSTTYTSEMGRVYTKK